MCANVLGTQEADPIERPDPDEGAADHLALGNRAVERESSDESPRWSPITHSCPSGTVHRPERLPADSGVVVVDVRLVERRAVDGDPALRVAAGHGVAADADDPLDEVLLPRRASAEQAAARRAAPRATPLLGCGTALSDA